MRGPTDLPNRRPAPEGGTCEFTRDFDDALATFVEDEDKRRMYKRDVIEFRMERRSDIQMVTGDADLGGQGYIITEDGNLGVPACVAWFRSIQREPGRTVFLFDDLRDADAGYEEEDDT